MANIKVIIATHKPADMPDDSLYLPVYVGAYRGNNPGYQSDNEGDQISERNPYFCELTGLYWAWKNLDADYIGLCHYRRYMGLKKPGKKDRWKDFILTEKEAEKLLQGTDIIVPVKRHYYVETIYSHYDHTMYIEPMDVAGQIISEKYPDYSEEFEKLKVRRSAHLFNMFIMKKDILDDYCKWLFDILFEMENRVDSSQYNAFHSRFYGRISERLLDVYLNTNHLTYKEVKLIDTGSISWKKKITGFIKAKVFRKKYEESF